MTVQQSVSRPRFAPVLTGARPVTFDTEIHKLGKMTGLQAITRF